MASHKLAKIHIAGMDIAGYSVAGEETVIAVESLDVCFDIGKAPDQFIPINNVLLSHGHIDHAAGVGYYLSHRNFCGQRAGNILASARLLVPIKKIIDAWGELDGSIVPANLIAIKSGEEFKIKPNLFARAFPVAHCRDSLGYTIIEKRKKIKPEYASLSGPQIVELKQQNIRIDNSLEIPLVTYLGDTAARDYSSLDYVSNSKVLITECTFYEDEHADRADAGKHVHVKDLAGMLEVLNNDHIVLIHATQRTSLSVMKSQLKKFLPSDLNKKTILFMDRANFSAR